MKAFPQTRITINGDKDITTADLGMDLRDYFAAKVMPLFLQEYHNCKCEWNAEFIANDSYVIADAMMKARVSK
jgi:hypothetical protein